MKKAQARKRNTKLVVTRAILGTVLALLIIVPAALYLVMSSETVHRRLRDIAQTELSELLGTRVEIGAVSLRPFSRVDIRQVTVADDRGDTALSVGGIEARVELVDYLRSGRFIVDYICVSDPEIKIYKDSVGAPLNIAGIVERLKSDNREKSQTKFALRVNEVRVKNGRLSYDVLSQPRDTTRFDIDHIALSDLNLEIFAPMIGSEGYDVNLRSLSFKEQSGFTLKRLWVDGLLTEKLAQLRHCGIELPNSRVELSPMSIEIDGVDDLATIGLTRPVSIGIEDQSRVYLPDLQVFAPMLRKFDTNLGIAMHVDGTIADIDIGKLQIKDLDSAGIEVDMAGTVRNALLKDRREINVTELRAKAYGAYLGSIIGDVSGARNILSRIGMVTLDGSATLHADRLKADMLVTSGRGGKANVSAKCIIDGMMPRAADAQVNISRLNLAQILANADMGELSGVVTAEYRPDMLVAAADITQLCFKGYEYTGINATLSVTPEQQTVTAEIDDPNVNAIAHAVRQDKTIDAGLRVAKFIPDTLNLLKHFPGHSLSLIAEMKAEGDVPDRFVSDISIEDVRFANSETGAVLDLGGISVAIDNVNPVGHIYLQSDIVEANVEGRFDITTVADAVKKIISDVRSFKYVTDSEEAPICNNNFKYDLTVKNAEELSKFLDLPMTLIYPVTINGELDCDSRQLTAFVDAPWLQQGDKIIEDATASLMLDGEQGTGIGFVTVRYPTNKGPMEVVCTLRDRGPILETNIDWMLERAIPLQGSLNFTTIVSSNEDAGTSKTFIKINPGEINFGDDIWHIEPAYITYCDGLIAVDGLDLHTDDGQQIVIDGAASENPEDILNVGLTNVKVEHIFETLEINSVLISGRATGSIYCKDLSSRDRVVRCDNLHVKDIGYNYTTIGDADLVAFFDNDKQGFSLDADITGKDGHKSRIYGDILPESDILDIHFDIDHAPAGFLRPFLKTFTTEVGGYASGKLRLFGTFSNVDLEGYAYADPLDMRIAFTNVMYSVRDTVHFSPGLIEMDCVEIKDQQGHTALMDGYVRHNHFLDGRFHFDISQAQDILAVDLNKKQSPVWHGHVYGTGGVSIDGEPGKVNIDVNMETAPNSSLQIELSKISVADEYSFITFRDVTPEAVVDSILDVNIEPEAVTRWRNGERVHSDVERGDITVDLRLDINDNADITLVMNPVSGDGIKAKGDGNLQLKYTSTNNDLWMLGTYTINNGDYRFSLQDIIIKDFAIEQGSQIKFNGDPDAVQLDIKASYTTMANLTDLDESFLMDKDLNNTKVRTQAVLNVTGDIRQPDIAFDLAFPNLNEEVYRKVRSIVSTEEMMNRQIIYLLALNRFYTPDYMESTTKGNELFSVASSTISSQLSSILGKLSDNWSIAPNLRSDRGDFSDLEVDVELSSRLLNNRLLFNGNLGYRDKTMNTNQFVGDFDIEYLLSPSGTWRLKAYNRYNDQNYYLRTAATTQGIGIMYKKDFDKLFK